MHNTAKTVQEYVAAHNLYADFFMATAPDRWHSKFDATTFLEDGINTVEKLRDYLFAEHMENIKDEFYIWQDEYQHREVVNESVNFLINMETYMNQPPLSHNPFLCLAQRTQ